MAYHNVKTRGISLIEVLLMVGLIGLFFFGLLGAFRGVFELIGDSKARQTALTVALQTVETVRMLRYDDVGTISGIPAGLLPQVSTTTKNNIAFTTSILIEYVDDPADGLDSLDSNSVTNDYKRVTVNVAWQNRQDETRSIVFTSNISPPSIESDTGGGTLRVNVVDASLNPVSGATVRLINSGLVPAINTTRTTSASGVVLFSGAPTASGYEIEVSRAGYTSDQTHVVTPSFTNPLATPVTVVEGNVTTATFFIDRVSELSIQTLSNQVIGQSVLSVTDMSDVVSSNNVASTAGGMTLTEVGGVYEASGFVQFIPISSSTTVAWQAVSIEADLPSGTGQIVQLYDGNNPGVLIPDSVLPGNSVGFTGSTIPLNAVDVSVYPSISIRVSFDTANTAVTPVLSNIVLSRIVSETVLPNVSLAITGNRSIGTDSGGSSVIRNQLTTTTDGAGESIVSNVEWDFYSITPTGYVIAEACPAAPVAVTAGVSIPLRLLLSAPVATSLRVQVIDVSSTPLNGAVVTVSRPGFSSSITTESCGQVFFSSLSATQYEISASAPGYTTETIPSLSISGNDTLVIQLLP